MALVDLDGYEPYVPPNDPAGSFSVPGLWPHGKPEDDGQLGGDDGDGSEEGDSVATVGLEEEKVDDARVQVDDDEPQPINLGLYKPRGASLGVTFVPDDEQPWCRCARVKVLQPGGLAERSGLREGDIVACINGAPVEHGRQAALMLREVVGDVSLVVVPTTASDDVADAVMDDSWDAAAQPSEPLRHAPRAPQDPLAGLGGMARELLARMPSDLGQVPPIRRCLVLL